MGASPSLLSWRWPWHVSGVWPCQSQPGTPKAGSPSKPDFLTKVIQTEVYDCIRKCAHISNDFPVQPARLSKRFNQRLPKRGPLPNQISFTKLYKLQSTAMMRKHVHISNDFPIQPAQPAQPVLYRILYYTVLHYIIPY